MSSPKHNPDKPTTKIAIVGGGPSALMLYKNLVDARAKNLCGDIAVDIFEADSEPGCGMPYSDKGAGREHITNVSSDELPHLVDTLTDWVKSLPDEIADYYQVDKKSFNEKNTLPRLLFGSYLTAQFKALIEQGKALGLDTTLHLETPVQDIEPSSDDTWAVSTHEAKLIFDKVIITIGHRWPKQKEGRIAGYFDSPYPPAKLVAPRNHTVVVRGSSLTAIDAVATMSRSSGEFVRGGSGSEGGLTYVAYSGCEDFKVVMHSRHGLLPCIRVHMEEPHVGDDAVIDQAKLDKNMAQNEGFLELDFLFEEGFKKPLAESQPDFYARIKNMSIEEFVQSMMAEREGVDPFDLFVREYREAEKSIEKERPVYWKEMLSGLSFAMNYPAKHLSAEDMLRLKKCLMPLISVVIAFLPQPPCEELIALHAAGRLEIVAGEGDGQCVEDTNPPSDKEQLAYIYTNNDGEENRIDCGTFIDCIGQKPLQISDMPFKSLLDTGSISAAKLGFKSSAAARELIAKKDSKEEIFEQDGVYFLKVPGAAIGDSFETIDPAGRPSKSLYLMSVPYISGYNPDYSGLDFCEHASGLVISDLLSGLD